MHVIRARNVAEAWPQGLELLLRGDQRPSRNGPVRAHSVPVATVYERPTERLVLDPVRDANPYFLLFESLWMLAGRDDCAWLDQFVGDFSARFGEPDSESEYGPGLRQHGAYGRRWRGWFERIKGPGFGRSRVVDQIEEIVRLLRADPFDRQCVLQMWDCEADLGVPGLRDRPCNLVCTLRADRGVLDMQVFCRSNDAIWGCYSANACHFSVLLEYLAARVGLPVGEYTQISVNLHLYDSSVGKASLASAQESARRPYPGTLPLVDDPEWFDDDLRMFLANPTNSRRYPRTPFLHATAHPMFMSNLRRREKDWARAHDWARHVAAPDWRAACVEWVERRVAKR